MTSSTDDRRAASSAPRGTSNGTRCLGQRPLGPDDALGDGRLGDEERARDLLGRQAPEQAQRERDARLGREHRMAGREHQAQEVVADVVVERGVEIGRGRLLLRLELAAELLVLALEQLVPAQQVDRAMLRGGHEPGARVVRDARLRPLLERGDERVLRQLLGQPDVAHDPREAGDEPGRLDPPDRVDRAMGVGSRHGYRSEHRPPSAQVTASPTPSSTARRRSSCSLSSGVSSVAEVLRLEHLANLDLALLGMGRA